MNTISKRLVIAAVCIFMVMGLFSCMSKEDRALQHLRDFTEKLETEGAKFDIDQWKDAAKEFTSIRTEISKYQYSPEENQEIGKLEARCATAFATNASNNLIKDFLDLIPEVKGAVDELSN
ncbi:MAG: hypothetical protein SPD86_09630 [Prevotella sp.]|nr:hypothetical protein [Prevotella sp.]